jgi:hypothetical protein
MKPDFEDQICHLFPIAAGQNDDQKSCHNQQSSYHMSKPYCWKNRTVLSDFPRNCSSQNDLPEPCSPFWNAVH